MSMQSDLDKILDTKAHQIFLVGEPIDVLRGWGVLTPRGALHAILDLILCVAKLKLSSSSTDTSQLMTVQLKTV